MDKVLKNALNKVKTEEEKSSIKYWFNSCMEDLKRRKRHTLVRAWKHNNKLSFVCNIPDTYMIARCAAIESILFRRQKKEYTKDNLKLLLGED